MKKGFWYRFFVILIAYLLAGAVTLGVLANKDGLPNWLLWTLLGCFVGAFALTVGINEYVIYRKHNNKA